jgi:hypothetical protein
LLDLAAGKSERAQREERVVVRLEQAVERVVKRFEIPAQEKHITLETRIERDVKISATEQGGGSDSQQSGFECHQVHAERWACVYRLGG